MAPWKRMRSSYRGTLRSQRRSHRRKGVPQLIESNEGHTTRQAVIRYRPLVDLARAEHGSSLHLASSGSLSRQKPSIRAHP